MKGYHNRQDATKESIDADGWFETGDMAKRDDDGFYFIVDRKKELIIRGGYNIYPREIEEVLYGHPAIAEVAVIGVPDDRRRTPSTSDSLSPLSPWRGAGSLRSMAGSRHRRGPGCS